MNKFNSVVYGYSLHLEMKGNSLYSLKEKAILAKLKIQTTFCIAKCIVAKRSRRIMDSQQCHYLLVSDITGNTNGSFAEIYDNSCSYMNQTTLDWSIDLHVSNLLKSKGLEVLLPGIYEKAEINVFDQNFLLVKNEDQFTIRWFNRRIIKRINTSLLLNGKRYLIFS